jgi:hypothetical protein
MAALKTSEDSENHVYRKIDGTGQRKMTGIIYTNAELERRMDENMSTSNRARKRGRILRGAVKM